MWHFTFNTNISLSVHRSVQFGCTIEMGLAQMKSLCLEDHRVYESLQNHTFISQVRKAQLYEAILP